MKIFMHQTETGSERKRKNLTNLTIRKRAKFVGLL